MERAHVSDVHYEIRPPCQETKAVCDEYLVKEPEVIIFTLIG